jgi:RimJ/RimL family protein N-acetyltransferase
MKRLAYPLFLIWEENMDRKVFITNNLLSLVEHQKSDDRALYENWQDPATQRGYNFIRHENFDEYTSREIRQRFFAMIRLNSTDEIIGAVGISPPESTADLAIWLFNPYRRQGYGTNAFALATEYAVKSLNIKELHAGAYPDNIGSLKMLRKCGYIPYPEGNVLEKHYLTGADLIQYDFIYKIKKRMT